VGSPIHEGGQIPHWSRWEATATTFGPWGRIVATALVVLTLIPAIAFNGFIYAITFPFVATILLREIWAKGWYVPESGSPEHPERTRPESSLPKRPESQTISVSTIIRWGLVLAASVALAYGNDGIKTAVVSFATIWLLVWLWTGFDR
jgi:hypothetical protein